MLNREKPKVSVVCATYNRERYYPYLYRWFQEQTYPNQELLILDDGDKPSNFFSQIAELNSSVVYTHLSQQLSRGAKLNTLIDKASGDLIINFDEGDYYAPNYIELM